MVSCHLRWGLLSQFPPWHYFPSVLELPQQRLHAEYQVHIWQVSWAMLIPVKYGSDWKDLTCDFTKSKEINKHGSVPPHPWMVPAVNWPDWPDDRDLWQQTSCPLHLPWMLYAANRACCPGGHYWDYHTGTLSCSQFTASHLKNGYP